MDPTIKTSREQGEGIMIKKFTRREFVKAAGVGGVVAATTNLAAPFVKRTGAAEPLFDG